MIKAVMVNIGILLFIIVMYFILRNFTRTDRGYEQLYNEVVQSEEYKVKGRNE
jgi:hypothetical protein